MKYGGRCLSCGVPLVEQDMYYHPKCAKRLFDSLHIPALNYTQRNYSDDDSFFIDLDAYAARTQT